MRAPAAIFLLLVTAVAAFAAQADFPRGEIIPKVVTQSDPAQSYALYLPKSYDAGHKWPVVFLFDPMGGCVRPMPMAAKVAEEFGYIVACANNSKNGPSGPQMAAARATLTDVGSRFPVDPERSYTAGFSGGARVASSVAQLCRHCMAGVFMMGASFSDPTKDPTSAEVAPFDVFMAVGDQDPNFKELVQVSHRLEALGIAYRLSEFSGPHQWAPEKQWHEAFAWFAIRAQKARHAVAGPEVVKGEVAETKALIEELTAAGKFTRVLPLLQQSAKDFAGTDDGAQFAKRAAELASDKRYVEAKSREDADLARQEALVSELYGAIRADQTSTGGRTAPPVNDASANRPASGIVDPMRAGHIGDPPVPSPSGSQLESKIKSLRSRREKADERERNVITRSLTSVFIGAFEGGQQAMEEKNYRAAEYWFDVASKISLKPAPMYVHMAGAQLASGDRKAALRSLKKALQTDASTAEFIRSNEELASLHSDPEFNKLLTSHSANPVSPAK